MTDNHIQIVQATLEDLDGIVPIFDQYRVFHQRESNPDGAQKAPNLTERFGASPASAPIPGSNRPRGIERWTVLLSYRTRSE